MDFTEQTSLVSGANVVPRSVPAGHVLLILLVFSPILVIAAALAVCYYQRYAERRAEDERIEAILVERGRIAAYRARQLAMWEARETWAIETERLRTLATLEGLVEEAVTTDRSAGC
jgi:hypothetical protein